MNVTVFLLSLLASGAPSSFERRGPRKRRDLRDDFGDGVGGASCLATLERRDRVDEGLEGVVGAGERVDMEALDRSGERGGDVKDAADATEGESSPVVTDDADSRGDGAKAAGLVSGERASSMEGDWRKGELVTLLLDDRPTRPAD